MYRCIARIVFIVALSALLGVSQAQAEDRVRVWYLEDAQQYRYTLETVINNFRSHPEDWSTSQKQSVNLGLVDSAYWFIWRSTGVIPASEQIRVVQIQNATIDEMSFWFLDKDFQVLKRGSVGDHLPFNHRMVLEPGYAASFPADAQWIVARVQTSDLLALTNYIYTGVGYMNSVRVNYWHFGIYAGVTLAMLIYNSFLSLRLKIPGVRAFCFWTLVMFLNLAVTKGYAYQYLWPSLPKLNAEIASIISPLSGFACLLLTYYLLDFPSRLNKALLTIYRIVLSANVLLIIGSTFMPDALSLAISYKLIFVTILTLLCANIHRIQQGDSKARIVLGGWFFYLFSSIPTLLYRRGVQVDYDIVTLTLMVGTAMLVLLFSLLISLEARRVFVAKKHAAEELVRSSSKNNALLNHEVAKRTLALRQANRRLLIETYTDSSSGLRNNDYFFDGGKRYIESSLLRARRIALLLIEVEDFDKMRSLYGYDYSEQCLRRVGENVKQALLNRTRIVCRLDNNQIAALVNIHSENDAFQLAEIIHQKTCGYQFQAEGLYWNNSCAVGVTAFTANSGAQLSVAFHCAERALEMAMEHGSGQIKFLHFVDEDSSIVPA